MQSGYLWNQSKEVPVLEGRRGEWRGGAYSSREHVCCLQFVVLLNAVNKLASSAITSWMEIWVRKLATQVLRGIKSSWSSFWYHTMVFTLSLIRLAKCWLAFIKSALSLTGCNEVKNQTLNLVSPVSMFSVGMYRIFYSYSIRSK